MTHIPCTYPNQPLCVCLSSFLSASAAMSLPQTHTHALLPHWHPVNSLHAAWACSGTSYWWMNKEVRAGVQCLVLTLEPAFTFLSVKSLNSYIYDIFSLLQGQIKPQMHACSTEPYSFVEYSPLIGQSTQSTFTHQSIPDQFKWQHLPMRKKILSITAGAHMAYRLTKHFSVQGPLVQEFLTLS